MKSIVLRIIAYFYSWIFGKNSYSRKRKKVIKRKKEIAKRMDTKTSKKMELIVFKDEKGVVCFSIQTDSLFYIESDMNYIKIYYHNQGKLEYYLMRSSLKMVLEENKNEILVRCHRSYIVNFKKIILYKKSKEGGIIELSDASLPPIPVSKSYIENVLSKFQFQ
jgi:DNA-binding LytR/AlgR family response regulator